LPVTGVEIGLQEHECKHALAAKSAQGTSSRAFFGKTGNKNIPRDRIKWEDAFKIIHLPILSVNL
jgi:hypothetical protein